jgi:putative transposase
VTESMTTKKPKKQKAPSLIPVELIDQLLAQVQNKDAESILGETGLAGQLKKLLAERMLTAELSHHLANEDETGNYRQSCSLRIHACAMAACWIVAG